MDRYAIVPMCEENGSKYWRVANTTTRKSGDFLVDGTCVQGDSELGLTKDQVAKKIADHLKP